MVEIPINTDGSSYVTQSVNVGGVSLSMRLLWNGRDSAWYADFESADGKNNGVKLVVNTPLLGNKNRCLVEGDLVLLQSVTDDGHDLGFDNLGTEFSLIYMTKEEVTELLNSLVNMVPDSQAQGEE